LYRRVPPAG